MFVGSTTSEKATSSRPPRRTKAGYLIWAVCADGRCRERQPEGGECHEAGECADGHYCASETARCAPLLPLALHKGLGWPVMPAFLASALLAVVLTRPRGHRILEVAFRPMTETSWG